MTNILIMVVLLCSLCPGQSVTSGNGTEGKFNTSFVSVSPSVIGVPVGNTVQFAALELDNFGNQAPACASSGWASTNAGIASIGATGLATAISAGTVTISCTVGALTPGTATLVVELAPNFTTPSLPCVQPCPLPAGVLGTTYRYQLAGSGGTAPYTFSLIAGTTPSGISFNSSGLLSGTPSLAGTSIFTIQICDSLSACSQSLQVSIFISSNAVTQNYYVPQQFATKIINPTFTTTRVLGPTGGNFYQCASPDACFVAMQQAACDWANDGVDDNWLIKMEPGPNPLVQTGVSHNLPSPCVGGAAYHSFTGIPKIVSGNLPTGVIVFDSTTPLTSGQTVCSHGIGDSATRQPPSGDIGTWWTGTNYGCSNDIGSMWKMESNWPTGGNAGVLIQGGQWDSVTNLGAAGYVFKNAEFRNKPGTATSGANVDPSYGSLGSLTQTSQGPSNWHFENIYAHGDATDWCNRVGGITQYSVNAGGTGYVKNDTGTINTGSGTATYIIYNAVGGVAKIATITLGGSGYSTGTGVATTRTSGAGSGMTVNIYAVAGSSTACVSSFNTGGPGTNSASYTFNFQDCMNCSLAYSYIDYMPRLGNGEGHNVQINRTPGPVSIVHNWLSGQSMNVFTGGIAQTDPLYAVKNVEIRNNRLTLPQSWVGSPYQAQVGGTGFLFKNRVELKACQYCLVDGNIMEYSDASGGQQGQCIEANPRSCSNGLQCDNPQDTVQGLTVTNNICRHALSGFNMVNRSNYPANGGGVAPPLRYVNVANNLFYDLGNANFYDHFNTQAQQFAFRVQSSGEGFICPGTRSGTTITLTCIAGPTGLSQTQIYPGDYITVEGCSDSTWNLPAAGFPWTPGPLALAGTTPAGFTVVYSNASAVSSSATDCVVSNTEGGPASVTVVHNTLVMDATQASKNQAQMYVGTVPQIPSDTGCTGAGPTTSTAITAISRAGNIVTATVASLTGWDVTLAGNQTIVEVSGVTPSSFNGKYYYLGQAGGKLTWQQVAANDTGTVFGTAAQMGTCPTNFFAQNNTWKDNLTAMNTTSAPACPGSGATGGMGWDANGDGNAEGCSAGFTANGCSENMLDAISSIATYANFNGRCSTKFTEMGGANAGANPPITLTFPASAVCSGATATAACVGMTGMMNGVAFDTNDANYHNYGLVSTSVYHNAADDGTDLGVDYTALDAAQTSTIYGGCSANSADNNYCGPGGATPDH
jgi:hypothetical protein